MTACPAATDLRNLMANAPTVAPAVAIERHVETCPACQRALADLTESADAARWRQLLSASGNGQPAGVEMTPPPPPEAADPLPAIPGYRIVRAIGRGGAATVYLARQVSLNRLVALKTLHLGAKPDAVQRFRAEAEAAARLRHPNIVIVHEIGEHAGRFFLAMEYVEGGTLADMASRKPMPAGRAAELLENVSRAVDHAHAAGVVHRDIKPSNILLQRHAESAEVIPKVADFGLAHRVDDDAGLTRTHDLLGTPGYMAPEMVVDAGAASPRSDVYAIGVVLYELLTGRPPFIGGTPLDTLLQARDREPVPPQRLQPGVPPDLQTVCLKCLEKDPQRRYATAGELADELQCFLNGQPVRARPVSPAGHALRWARRHKALAALMSLLAILVVGGSAVAFAAATYFRHMARDMEQLAGEKDAERLKAEEQRELTLRTLYFTRVNLAGQSLPAMDSNFQVEQFLREWRGLKAASDPRGWEWFYLNARARRAELRLHGHELDILALAWSPDGRRLASAGFGRALHIWDGDTGRQLSRTTAGWGVRAIAWSPDGQRILTGGADNTVFVHDAETGRQTQQLLADHKPVAWSPDWQHFLGFAGNTVVQWDAAGHQTGEYVGHAELPVWADWSPAGDAFATGDSSGRLCIWDRASRTPRRDIATGSAIARLKWSRDGRCLACSHSPARITVWDVATGRRTHELALEPASTPAGMDFSPDGRTLAAGNGDSSVRLWDLATGRERDALAEHSFTPFAVAFRPDGQWLASGCGNWNGQIKLWRLADAGKSQVLTTIAELGSHLAWWSAPEQVTVGDSTGFRTLDARTGATLRSVAGSPLPFGGVSGDGLRWVGRDAHKVLTLWHVNGQSQPLPAGIDEISVRRIMMSYDGRFLAAVGLATGTPNRRRLQIWDVQTQQLAWDGTGGGGGWSPNSQWFAVGDLYNVSILDARTFQAVASWPSPDIANVTLVFRPDNQQLACLYNNNVVVREPLSGRILFQLVGHNNAVQSVQWSPDQARIATAAADGTVRLWDGTSGQLILTLPGRAGLVHSAAWNPDGQRLLSAGGGVVKIWDATRGFELEQIHAPLPTAIPSAPEGKCLHEAAGWWVIDEEEWDPAGPDPFAHAKVRPRWYSPADDPNGFVPLAGEPKVYLTRFYLPAARQVTPRTAGEIVARLWLDGRELPADRPTPLGLTAGWHTLAAAVADPAKQPDVVSRIGARLFVRLDAD